MCTDAYSMTSRINPTYFSDLTDLVHVFAEHDGMQLSYKYPNLFCILSISHAQQCTPTTLST